MDHNCSTCALKVPECGRKRKVSEGYCNSWVSSKEFTVSPTWTTQGTYHAEEPDNSLLRKETEKTKDV